MDIKSIQASYSRWAPVYDRTFGAATNMGRRRAVDYINRRGGSVLEVGVGTGLSLEHYGPHMQVTGIDFSREMLDKAVAKVQRLGLKQVQALRQMDARALDFPDDHFDTVTAMHVLSVVPEPERVMAEIAQGDVLDSRLFEVPIIAPDGRDLGTIETAANEDGGATFRFSLPAYEETD